jgi:hypothetical protein
VTFNEGVAAMIAAESQDQMRRLELFEGMNTDTVGTGRGFTDVHHSVPRRSLPQPDKDSPAPPRPTKLKP